MKQSNDSIPQFDDDDGDDGEKEECGPLGGSSGPKISNLPKILRHESP